MQLASKFTILEQEEYASAGAVAAEVLSAIKTVVAFGGEEKEFQRYDLIASYDTDTVLNRPIARIF